MTMTSFHFSERSKKAMNDIIVLYEYYTIIPDNNLGYIFEVNGCKYVKFYKPAVADLVSKRTHWKIREVK